MITFNIAIQEEETGRVKIAASGDGLGSPVEVELANRIRSKINEVAEEFLAEMGNGKIISNFRK